MGTAKGWWEGKRKEKGRGHRGFRERKQETVGEGGKKICPLQVFAGSHLQLYIISFSRKCNN